MVELTLENLEKTVRPNTRLLWLETPTNPVLRLTDISLDVDSEAAFGLLGAAAKAAIPYIQDALEQNAQIDLKPFAASARTSTVLPEPPLSWATRRMRGMDGPSSGLLQEAV